MTVGEVLIVGLVTVLGATAQGSTGVGLGLVAGPPLVAIDPDFVPGPLLLASVLVGFRHVVAERDNIDRPVQRRLILGTPIGVVAAIVVLRTVDDRVLGLLIGGLVVAAGLVLLAGVTLPRTPPWEVAGGAATAFTAVSAALPGPPLVMTLHDKPGPVMRPMISITSIALAAVAVVLMATVGLFGRDEAVLVGVLAPFVGLGLLVAAVVRPWLDRSYFRPVILTIAVAGGLALFVESL